VNALMLPALQENSSGEASQPVVNISQYLFSFAEACFQRLVQPNFSLLCVILLQVPVLHV